MYNNYINEPNPSIMKTIPRIFSLLLLAALSVNLSAQGPVVVLDYMKVTQDSEGLYLDVEKAWKKIHQKRIEEGLSNGWQLWRNVYAGYGDPYQYVTINWYENWEQSFAEEPEGFWDGIFEGSEGEILRKTLESRILVTREVKHQWMTAENSRGSKLIQINHMKIFPGKWDEYLKLEGDIYKPLQEARIEDGQMEHWSLWFSWPYKEGQSKIVTVDGFKDAHQMAGGDGKDLLSEVHPGKTWEKLNEKLYSAREVASGEIWELVDAVFPEE